MHIKGFALHDVFFAAKKCKKNRKKFYFAPGLVLIRKIKRRAKNNSVSLYARFFSHARIGHKKTETRMPRISVGSSGFLFAVVCAGVGKQCVFPEQQGQAPYAGKRDQCVDDSADDRTLTAENPRHDVKLKQADAAPVERTDDDEDQRNSVKHSFQLLLCVSPLVCAAQKELYREIIQNAVS